MAPEYRGKVHLTTQTGVIFATCASDSPRDPATAAKYDEAGGGYVPDPDFGKWEQVD